MTAQTKQTMYFVVPAEGHYGDSSRVMSAHRTLSAARRASGTGYVVREGGLKRGDVWMRVYSETYREMALVTIEVSND